MFPLYDTSRSLRFPLTTLFLILINMVVFVWHISSADIEQKIFQFALIPARISFEDPTTLYPLVTSMFLHAGFLHIMVNMWFLWVFGWNIEASLRSLFLPLYFFSGIVGNLVEYFLFINSTIPGLGASGAVAGVMGAYLVLFPKNRIKTIVPIIPFFMVVETSAAFMTLYWVSTQILLGLESVITRIGAFGGIAWSVHVAGFITGVLIGALVKVFSQRVPARS